MSVLTLETAGGRTFGRAIIEGRTVSHSGCRPTRNIQRPDQPRATGIRAAVSVPLVRTENDHRWLMDVIRTEPRAFSQKQIELLETFADQAVIAIENVRLFDEVEARTDDLTQPFQQRTATVDVSN